MVGGQDTPGKSENTLSSDWMQGNHFPSENSERLDLEAQMDWAISVFVEILKIQKDNALSSKLSLMRRRLD